jgi:hypothetical protein
MGSVAGSRSVARTGTGKGRVSVRHRADEVLFAVMDGDELLAVATAWLSTRALRRGQADRRAGLPPLARQLDEVIGAAAAEAGATRLDRHWARWVGEKLQRNGWAKLQPVEDHWLYAREAWGTDGQEIDQDHEQSTPWAPAQPILTGAGNDILNTVQGNASNLQGLSSQVSGMLPGLQQQIAGQQKQLQPGFDYINSTLNPNYLKTVRRRRRRWVITLVSRRATRSTRPSRWLAGRARTTTQPISLAA